MAEPPLLPDDAEARALLEASVEQTLTKVGRRVVLGLPLGIGKPNAWVNELYRRAVEDRSLDLTILTALTLVRPRGRSELERRFLGPLAERWCGNWPDLGYALDRAAGRLPPNVRVIEFYLPPGRLLGNHSAQQNALSTNFTAVARDAIDRGMNVFAQALGAWEDGSHLRLSLSSNPDVTAELLDTIRRRRGTDQPLHFVGQVNRALPFFGGDAELDREDLDDLLDHPGLQHDLYGLADEAVSDVEWAIALRASTLVVDGGTLQLGIGSLADAVAKSLCLRHRENAQYRVILEIGEMGGESPTVSRLGELTPFSRGLYASTEMFVRGFLELLNAGILKRSVVECEHLQELIDRGTSDGRVNSELLRALWRQGAIERWPGRRDLELLQRLGIVRAEVRWQSGGWMLPGGRVLRVDLEDEAHLEQLATEVLGVQLNPGTVLHGCFFLGPQRFYQALRDLPEDLRAKIGMTSVSRVNQIQGDERLRTAQRRNARFLNTAMKATCLGAACSDLLADGRVVSGVGGQQDFVSMAHDLPGARSILMVRAWRTDRQGRFDSNVVWNYGQLTIPRQQRDVVITEYGIADLRGRTDEECVRAMIRIADARAQPALLRAARAAGKVAPDWEIEPRHRENRPDKIRAWIGAHRSSLPRFPFGTDLTPVEQELGRALRSLKHARIRPAS